MIWINIFVFNFKKSIPSKSFTNLNDGGRYVESTGCVFYFNFNSDANDDCDDASNDLSLTGITTGSGGKMGNGLLPDGSGYAEGSVNGIDISSAWSFEAWVNPTTTDSGVILCICDDDATKSENELIIQLQTGNELQVKYDGGGIGENMPVQILKSNLEIIGITLL